MSILSELGELIRRGPVFGGNLYSDHSGTNEVIHYSKCSSAGIALPRDVLWCDIICSTDQTRGFFVFIRRDELLPKADAGS